LWPFFLRSRPRPPYRRERIELPDGDFLDLDWLGPHRVNGPLVVILHGLEGSSSSHYVRALAHNLTGAAVTSVVMHQRGCGGEPNRLARFYHGGETGDLKFVLDRLSREHPDNPLYAVGYSLGANILLKWLGESGDDSRLDAAAAVSVPFRLDEGARRLEQGLSRIYQYHLVDSMKRSVARKRRFMTHPVDPARLKVCRSFEEIDTCLTAPLHGFRDARDYYERSSCRQFLNGIRTRTLIVHARDDPFMTPVAIPGEDELSPTTRLELSPHGGHCGFVSGTPWRPRYWLDERIPAFIESCIKGSHDT
jgi:predicted alpha/beta-fold hydrolase